MNFITYYCALNNISTNIDNSDNNISNISENKIENKEGNIDADNITEEIMSEEDIMQIIKNLNKTVKILHSQNQSERLLACKNIRKILSIERNPPIDQVIKAGAIPPLVKLLNNDPDEIIQFEAAWALTNISCGTTEQVSVLLKHNAAKAFINKMKSNTPIIVKEQSVWAIGCIAGDSDMCRDHLLQIGTMDILLSTTKEQGSVPLRRNTVWAISNLCRGTATSRTYIDPAIPILTDLLEGSDINIISDACWALSYIIDSYEDEEYNICEIVTDTLCKNIVRLLSHNEALVYTPALRFIGNIVTGDASITRIVINCGCLPALKQMLETITRKSTIREACWTISNITAGTKQDIQEVIETGVLDSLIRHASIGVYDIKKEACWAIGNATSFGTPEQVTYIIEKGCIECFSELISTPDIRVVAVSLESLEHLLKKGDIIAQYKGLDENPSITKLEQCKGLKNIENLVNHPSVPIKEKARRIILFLTKAAKKQKKRRR